MNELHVISWNLTRRCNLECSHCYLPADSRKTSGSSGPELSGKEALRIVDAIAAVNPGVTLILSGGEPLLREDLFAVSARASQRGMMVVVGSNGVLIDDITAGRLKESGVTGISIGIDSTDPDIHDRIRSSPGAWQKAIAAARASKNAGLAVQINTVVSGKNTEEMPAMLDLARTVGASIFSPFFLVCTGRGEKLTDIAPAEYEKTLFAISEAQGKAGLIATRTRCAPQLRRILYGTRPDSPVLSMGMGRCLAGTSYCRITPEGDVTPCPYLPLKAGNAREKEFGDIWRNSELFASFRNPSLKGKCGSCEFRILCGGCRARAYAALGDYLEADPWCGYAPRGGIAVDPGGNGERAGSPGSGTSRPVWTREAEDRLNRVPSFVRRMVRNAVERYAREKSRSVITPAIMEELKRKTGMGGVSGHDR